MVTSHISGGTKIVGIFGYPIEHTMSPRMHNAVFKAMGLDFVYVPFQVAPVDLEKAVQAIRILNLRGVNITIPHKTAVMKYLDYLSPEAKLIGAVNTIVNDNGVLKGYNTDGIGYICALKHSKAGFNPAGKKVVLFGTGGAAKAVGTALAQAGAASLTITGRQISKAAEIANLINSGLGAGGARAVDIVSNQFYQSLASADLVVNCTPIGMYPHSGTMPGIDLGKIPKNAVISDLIYNPLRTMLLKEAEKLGFRTVSGLGMLVQQGALAFEKWTRHAPLVDLMYQEVMAALEGEQK